MANINGTSGKDTLNGSNAKDTIVALDDDDLVDGRGGNDYLDGGYGSDMLFGGTGNDTLLGRDGVNFLYGGAGGDLIGDAATRNNFEGFGPGDVIYGDGFNTYTLVFGGVHLSDPVATTQQGDDTIHGSARDDLIYGDNGDLFFDLSSGGNDVVFAGNGSDLIYGEGGNDVLSGEGGDDTIRGGEGKDTISGGDGRDILIGGGGEDVIDAGAWIGQDFIVYYAVSDSSGNKFDTIVNFVSGYNYWTSGTKIDITALRGPGDDLMWNGTTPLANGVWYQSVAGGVKLLADVDGDANADFNVFLQGITSLKHSDILGVVNYAPMLIGEINNHDDPVAEAGDITASGTITLGTDRDGDALSMATPGFMLGTYGTLYLGFTGYWEYTLDPLNPLIDALTEGETATDTFSVVFSDGLLESNSIPLVITIIGLNDASVITGATSGVVYEDQTVFPGIVLHGSEPIGNLDATDVDGPDGVFQAVSGMVSDLGYGIYSVSASGDWVYTLDNTLAAVAALNDSDHPVDTFTVYAADGTAQVVSVTIDGKNDVAEITIPAAQSINEDTPLIFSAANDNPIVVSDPDSDILTVSISPAGFIPGGFITLTLAQTTGLTFNNGQDGIADTSLNFSGSVAAINSALDGLSFNGGNNSYGGVVLFVSVNDGSRSTGTQLLNITVNSVNDAPSGFDRTVNVNEDTLYTFTPNHFGLSDAENPGFFVTAVNSLAGVLINTLPQAGLLTLNGVAVTQGQMITRAELNTGGLKYLAAEDASGTGYANFTFQVQDSGGTANGGINLDPTPNTMFINVNAVNDAPAGVDKTVETNEDTPYVFATGDFGFSDLHDSPANALVAVKITTLPTAGILSVTGMGALIVGDYVSAEAISTGRLVFTPAADANGDAYAGFTFQVLDNGAYSPPSTSTEGGGGVIDGGSGLGFTITPVPVFGGITNPPLVFGSIGSGTLGGFIFGPIGTSYNLDQSPNTMTIKVNPMPEVLMGTSGNDILVGGPGVDTMTGGAGSDTFKFVSSGAGSADLVTDFIVADTTSDGDVLDISDLLGGTATLDTLGQFVSLRESGGNTIVGVDQDAGGVAPAQDIATLSGVTNLTLTTLVNNNQVIF